MPIRILSKEVINQIAAGEVLERPANLVKELVENSIDAGATEIDLDIDHGGKYIKIHDNGIGMKREDLSVALNRHATSKLSEFSDIWNLNTYGFRGEALASAAAVSQLSIVTRPKDSPTAIQVKSEFGNLSEVYEVGGEFGTQITVDELFANVPARQKFLKSDSAEMTQIMKVVKAFALCHPSVTFKVKQKGLLKAFYPKSDCHLDRVKVVLDIDEMFEGVRETSQMKAHVIYSSPNTVAKTSQNIWIFVQKRWIQDRALQKAILDSYRNLLMHGEYPYVVAFLDCDPQIVDVNIHPTKSQVKFQDAGMAFRSVHGAVRTSLEGAPWLKNMFNADDSPTEKIGSYYNVSTNTVLNEEPSLSSSFDFHRAQFKQKNYDMDTLTAPPVALQNTQTYTTEPVSPQTQLEVNSMWGSLQVLGQVNLTYILAQSRQALFLVDQHAAHERVNFEKLMVSFNKNEFQVQTFLLPITMDFEPDKFEALLNLKEDLMRIGIDIEQSGPSTVSVNSAPIFVKDKAVTEILSKMSEDALENGASYSLEKRISDIFATMACHSSVRAGQSLSSEEMKELLVAMDEFPLSSFCPHGRPVFKQFSFRELDKDFGRIV